MTDITLQASNSLADLAARIRQEHRAASDKMSEALLHAMAGGDLLIEAKALVQHGQWLPWLKDHVDISERTAQIYMRAAKNRAEIEASKAQSTADLSLGEAVALLALSSDVRKPLAFVKECEGLDGEELVQACLDANVSVVTTPATTRSLAGPTTNGANGCLWSCSRLGAAAASIALGRASNGCCNARSRTSPNILATKALNSALAVECALLPRTSKRIGLCSSPSISR
jgi:hypothetical protein